MMPTRLWTASKFIVTLLTPPSLNRRCEFGHNVWYQVCRINDVVSKVKITFRSC